MTVHARDWLELRDLLRENLGETVTDKLMDFLPPVGWADVATKHDVDALHVATKRDLDGLRVATKRDLDALRTDMTRDMDGLRSEMTRDMAALRGDMDAFRSEMKHDLEAMCMKIEIGLHRELARHMRWTMSTMIATATVAVGAAAVLA